MHKKVAVPIDVVDETLIPLYATPLASGCDVYASLSQPVTIAPGTTALVPLGIRVELPHGYEFQLRPRSGFAVKNQLTVLNSPGTIDCDYRGEICVILINHGKEPFIVKPKMRIAQMVLTPVVQAEFIKNESLTVTERGEGRFGHTGAS